jgi:hypothetical protein
MNLSDCWTVRSYYETSFGSSSMNANLTGLMRSVSLIWMSSMNDLSFYCCLNEKMIYLNSMNDYWIYSMMSDLMTGY